MFTVLIIMRHKTAELRLYLTAWIEVVSHIFYPPMIIILAATTWRQATRMIVCQHISLDLVLQDSDTGSTQKTLSSRL